MKERYNNGPDHMSKMASMPIYSKNLQKSSFSGAQRPKTLSLHRASDFFQDWWAEVSHGAKNDGSFSEIMGPSISN